MQQLNTILISSNPSVRLIDAKGLIKREISFVVPFRCVGTLHYEKIFTMKFASWGSSYCFTR